MATDPSPPDPAEADATQTVVPSSSDQAGSATGAGSDDLRAQISDMRSRGPSGPIPRADTGPPSSNHDGPKTIDRYRLLEQIGSGGMGELFVAWDDRLDRRVAIKLVHRRLHRELADQRLLREAKVLGQLSHPNVVGVHEVGVFEGRVYVVMEYVAGQSLRAWLESLRSTLEGAARARLVLAHFITAGRGLQAVHDAGLAHRDFKPENVLVGEDGRVRIVDFGLARADIDDDDTDEPAATPAQIEQLIAELDGERSGIRDIADVTPTLTEAGVLVGTPRYMAPEQWLGMRGDSRSDQFSFCVALYEALYRRRPYDALKVDTLSRKVQRGEFEIPPRDKSIPAPIREAVLRGLAPRPVDRFASMNALLEILERPAQRRRAASIVAVVVAVVLLASLAALLLTRPDPSHDMLHAASLRREVTATANLGRVEEQISRSLAQGSVDEADAAFAAFAELPEHADTLALARGWLGQGERLRRRGAIEAEIDAYAAAYASRSPSHRRLALLGLAHAFARTRQWPRLGATLHALDRLETLHGGALAALDEDRQVELRRMRVQVYAAGRNLIAAAQVLEGSRDDILLYRALRELSRTSSSDHVLDGAGFVLAPVPGLDLDRDGRDEIVVRREGERELSILAGTAGLPRISRIGWPDRGSLPVTVQAAGPGLLAANQGPRWSLHAIDADARGRIDTRELTTYLHAGDHQPYVAVADLDADGRREAYLALAGERRLLALVEPRDARGPWLARDAHPPTTATHSVLHDVTVADLDGDGDEEVIAAVGEWSAYDLRIYSADPDPDPGTGTGTDAEPGALKLLARRKLGAVHAVATLPAGDGDGDGPARRWIAVGVADTYPSRRMFPVATPGGVPGTYVFAWDGSALQPIAHVTMPFPTQIITGDFDGDGRHDLALGSRDDGGFTCTLLLQLAPQVFHELTLQDSWPVGAHDRDRDGDDELLLLATDATRSRDRPIGRLHILGTGDERLPTLELVASPPPRPEQLTGPLAATWTRAEDLAEIGLPLRAAARLVELARVTDPQTAAALELRAAELYRGQGRRLAEADALARAVALGARADPGGPPNAIAARAATTYEQIYRFDAAARLARIARDQADDPAARRELEARVAALERDAEPPSLRFDFDEPLDDRWAIDPLAVRRRHGRLELELGGVEFGDGFGPDHAGVVAQRELVWDGGPMALEVALEAEVLEWAAGVYVAILPLDAAASAGGERAPAWRAGLEVGVGAWGGGGIYELQLSCTEHGRTEPGSDGGHLPHPHAELPIGAPGRRLWLRAESLPGATRRWCTSDGEALHIESELPAIALAPGRYALQIRGSSGHWTRAKVSIDHITLTGLRDPDTPTLAIAPRHALGRALAEGRAESVLEVLAGAGAPKDAGERALLRFLAVDALGRWEAGEAALAELLAPAGDGRCDADPGRATALGMLLRHRPERLGPTLRRLCSTDSYFRSLMAVWSTAIHQHPEADFVERLLTTQTVGLERWSPPAAEDRLVVLTLLRTRAEAWSAQRANNAARADLGRAIELGERWRAELDPLADAPLPQAQAQATAWRLAFDAELGRARVALAAEYLADGEDDRAAAALREAIASSPTPELIEDMLAIDPRFRGQ